MAEAPLPKADTARQRRRFAQFVIILLWCMTAAQVPLLIFLWSSAAVPWGWLLTGFLLVNAQLIIRIRYLPRPDPPPVWFERYVIWPYFGLAVLCLYFAPGVALVWALALPEWAGWAWLTASAALSSLAAGFPWRRVVVRRQEIPIAGLPMAFDGLTIAQVTDLHLGPMCPERRATAWMRRINKLNPDLIFLTGDLIASGTGFVPALSRALGELRPRLEVVAIMGNHDYFGHAGDALHQMHQSLGHRLLNNAHYVLERNGASLVIAGVDDSWRKLTDLSAALEGAPDAPVILLSHDPDLFSEAALRGVSLQVSGHVHGGQLAVPFLGRYGSVLRPFGVPWIAGHYRRESSQLWLGAGLGTTGAPARIGVPSEIPLLTLRQAP